MHPAISGNTLRLCTRLARPSVLRRSEQNFQAQRRLAETTKHDFTEAFRIVDGDQDFGLCGSVIERQIIVMHTVDTLGLRAEGTAEGAAIGDVQVQAIVDAVTDGLRGHCRADLALLMLHNSVVTSACA